MSKNNVFECMGISKSFGGTEALKNVQFGIRPGEVHALLGENGAGKSTLMKIIIGLYKPDAGQMLLNGKPYMVKSPQDAIRKGISMIHQELNSEPHLTIAESIFLNREDVIPGTPFLDRNRTNRRAAEILRQFNFQVDEKKQMHELTLAQCQMIEIIKAVSCNAQMIIMDEPTSSLDSEETERLFRTIQGLKAKGVSIIYISHRMEEIFEVCDRVSVFRDGQYIGTKDLQETSKGELIAMMVGREVQSVFPKVDCEIGEVALKVEDLSGKGFSDISFEVHKGEILGVSGLVGSGRSETMRAIFGLDKISKGRIFLNGREIKITDPRDAIKHGIAMVNEDRKKFGLCLMRSIRENASQPNLWKRQRRALINQRREKLETLEICKKLRVKSASIEADAISLSGGNQQKVVLAKWILCDPQVLILDEPTRGVDVGAKSELHSLMCQFASQGMAIIMVSSELPEVMGMSDRILVYHEGRIRGCIDRKDIVSGNVAQEDIISLAFGHEKGA
ncbi:MAG: sugar ABC transporter ATP-binding protein [Christensenellaceae bacterium]|nr:sugar ABC transporter ATP-binding protein [Christensenellaceae bacterium]MEA5067809.1 sugar ABC transporter ATP-binding protein [Christensenellaceae bacterium]